MGICKMIYKDYRALDDLNRLIHYIDKEDNGLQRAIRGGYGVSVNRPEKIAYEFSQIITYFSLPNVNTMAHHLVISFEHTDPLGYALDFCQEYSQSRGLLGWVNFFGIHYDSNGFHAHFAFCPVNYLTGNRLDITNSQMASIRRKMMMDN